jgi:hypothetical protein
MQHQNIFNHNTYKRLRLFVATAVAALVMTLAISISGPVQAQANENACWGQASAVFAQMGEMGEHSSQFPTPRLGLRNLARLLYEAGILPDDTMQSLGAFVADELGLSISACQ